MGYLARAQRSPAGAFSGGGPPPLSLEPLRRVLGPLIERPGGGGPLGPLPGGAGGVSGSGAGAGAGALRNAL